MQHVSGYSNSSSQPSNQLSNFFNKNKTISETSPDTFIALNQYIFGNPDLARESSSIKNIINKKKILVICETEGDVASDYLYRNFQYLVELRREITFFARRSQDIPDQDLFKNNPQKKPFSVENKLTEQGVNVVEANENGFKNILYLLNSVGTASNQHEEQKRVLALTECLQLMPNYSLGTDYVAFCRKKMEVAFSLYLDSKEPHEVLIKELLPAIKEYVRVAIDDSVNNDLAKNIKLFVEGKPANKAVIVTSVWNAVDYYVQEEHYNGVSGESLQTKLKKLGVKAEDIAVYLIHGDKFSYENYHDEEGMSSVDPIVSLPLNVHKLELEPKPEKKVEKKEDKADIRNCSCTIF